MPAAAPTNRYIVMPKRGLWRQRAKLPAKPDSEARAGACRVWHWRDRAWRPTQVGPWNASPWSALAHGCWRWSGRSVAMVAWPSLLHAGQHDL